MLIQFNFKNFKSFRDDTTLDLSATKITEHVGHLRIVGKEKLLSACAIYGANASGKSNTYQAFKYMSSYVLDSFKFGGESDIKSGTDYDRVKQTPFVFDPVSVETESSFEVYFVDISAPSLKVYNYGFCVNSQGITEEWLNSKPKTVKEYRRVFYRAKNELDLVGLPSKSWENIKISLEKEALVVSLGAKLKIKELKLIRDWFIKNQFVDFGDPTENFFLSRLLPKGFAEDESVRKSILDYFASFDESIKGFKIEKIASETEEGKERIHIAIDVNAAHKMIGSDETGFIPLHQESGGTLKMFALYSALQAALENGSVLFVDELNARLHPLLVRNFIQTFLNPKLNPRNAQLIFTTHDAWQLSNDLLRRDEIWFTEKNPDGITSLYSLADFFDEDGVKIRKDESYEKNYLLGKYGAIPTLKSFDMFKRRQDEGK